MENDNSKDDILSEDASTATEKTMADRAKEVGRDGAYLEIDAKDLVAAYRSGSLQKSILLTINAMPIELSSSMDVDDFVKTVKDALEKVSSVGSEYYGLSDGQLGHALIRNCLLKGIK